MSTTPGYRIGILVVSDSVSSGQNVDVSGAALERLLRSEARIEEPLRSSCVADDRDAIAAQLRRWSDDDPPLDLVVTTGGTGFSPRDVTPEATRDVAEREAPQLAMRMALACCERVPTAALSRGVCVIRGRTLIVNLPGSSRGALENLQVILPILPHALDQLRGETKKVAALHQKIQAAD